MGIFARGRKLWVRYKDDESRWVSEPTGYSVGQEVDAEKCLARLEKLTSQARLQRMQPASSKTRQVCDADLTLEQYVERWLDERKELKLASWSDDAARLRLHVVPVIGEVALTSVSPKHIKAVILHHRRAEKLAPRSIRHVYGVMSTMFKDAVADELIRASPCVLRKGVLPKKVDKDPE